LFTAIHYINKGLLPSIEAPLMQLFTDFFTTLMQFLVEKAC